MVLHYLMLVYCQCLNHPQFYMAVLFLPSEPFLALAVADLEYMMTLTHESDN